MSLDPTHVPLPARVISDVTHAPPLLQFLCGAGVQLGAPAGGSDV
jgi:hypothetical protein